jgi:hypothetical protein
MTGWKQHNPVASLLSLLLAWVNPAIAAEQVSDEALPEAFLEFLAEWADERGAWQDPLVYENPEWQELDQALEVPNE